MCCVLLLLFYVWTLSFLLHLFVYYFLVWIISFHFHCYWYLFTLHFETGSIEMCSCGMPNLFSGLWQFISLDDALIHTKWPLSSSSSSGHLNSISYSLKYFNVAFTLPVHCYRARKKKLYNENKSFFPYFRSFYIIFFLFLCVWTVFSLFLSFLQLTIESSFIC